MGKSRILFGKDTVTKISTPEDMRVEVEKTTRAYDIGKNCGLFSVPKVLDFNESKGVAVFERISTMVPVANIMNYTGRHSIIFELIGKALAVIHKELVLPEDMTIELPGEFRLPGTDVYLHGDFNGVNVCALTNKLSIVILDWQMTSRHGGLATYGSRYFDLIWFINYFLWTPKIKYLITDPVKPIAKVFLASYFKETEFRYDTKILTEYSRTFFKTKFQDRKNNTSFSKRFLLPRCNVLTNRFISSLEMMNKVNL